MNTWINTKIEMSLEWKKKNTTPMWNICEYGRFSIIFVDTFFNFPLYLFPVPTESNRLKCWRCWDDSVIKSNLLQYVFENTKRSSSLCKVFFKSTCVEKVCIVVDYFDIKIQFPLISYTCAEFIKLNLPVSTLIVLSACKVRRKINGFITWNWRLFVVVFFLAA